MGYLDFITKLNLPQQKDLLWKKYFMIVTDFIDVSTHLSSLIILIALGEVYILYILYINRYGVVQSYNQQTVSHLVVGINDIKNKYLIEL